MNLNWITLILDLYKMAQRGSNCKTWYVLKSHFWLSLKLFRQNQNCICSPGKKLFGPMEELVIFEIESFNFCICQKTNFAWLDLEQASSWWINSKFCVYKVSIWRCLVILTFSGLHFLFYMTPLNFQQGLVQPPVDYK